MRTSLDRYYATPMPVPRPNDTPWANVLTGILEQNFGALQRVLAGILQNADSFSSKYMQFYAEEALAEGDLCVLSPTGGMVKANASAESTAASLVTISVAAVASGKLGDFLLSGVYATEGLSTGDTLYIGTVSGSWSNSRPGVSGHIVRVLGYALSSTKFFFQPDRTWTQIL